ncbi:hypothetical protein [Alkalicoccobacillus murimartini]|uniref:DUF3953 domain-containing protein n=1 Tax=Alkalicoccobacillus murimartini TaxID=171685 RepID=A0ABT9YMJ7_9BACI|nr:hypothetical protein [Alkalicoccobacillus murimartini]MDQ0208422.1 hypothetical protein [Alkalicoccobacillus murimartini]
MAFSKNEVILGILAILFFVASLFQPWFIIGMNAVFVLLLTVGVIAGFKGKESKYNRVVFILMIALVANGLIRAVL